TQTWVAPKSDVPLYNSDKLAASSDAKVIVCEGEKAADAAEELFPDFVAVTWYSGAPRVRQAPWDELTKRRVLGRFNGFLKSVILRVSEARDLGDINRFQFYDHNAPAFAKAAPPARGVSEVAKDPPEYLPLRGWSPEKRMTANRRAQLARRQVRPTVQVKQALYEAAIKARDELLRIRAENAR